MAENDEGQQLKPQQPAAADQQPPAQPQVIVVNEPPSAQVARAAAESQAANAANPLTETVPGGRYLVGDQLVDALGQPIKTKK